jgi:hypothetical protein
MMRGNRFVGTARTNFMLTEGSLGTIPLNQPINIVEAERQGLIYGGGYDARVLEYAACIDKSKFVTRYMHDNLRYIEPLMAGASSANRRYVADIIRGDIRLFDDDGQLLPPPDWVGRSFYIEFFHLNHEVIPVSVMVVDHDKASEGYVPIRRVAKVSTFPCSINHTLLFLIPLFNSLG